MEVGKTDICTALLCVQKGSEGNVNRVDRHSILQCVESTSLGHWVKQTFRQTHNVVVLPLWVTGTHTQYRRIYNVVVHPVWVTRTHR